MSHLFVGAGNSLQELQAVELDEEALRDIALRIKLQPHFLGESLVVIAEADDFPQLESEQVIVLVALDTSGHLVVIELRLGVARNSTPLHALRYASYLAKLNAEEIGKIARAFVVRPSNMSILRIWQEANVEMNDDSVELSSLLATAFGRDAEDYSENINSNQRIIIAAEGFDSRMVETVDWLARSGPDFRGLRYCKFMIGGQEIYQAQQIVPEVDPALDAKAVNKSTQNEVEEPWRLRGLQYYLERVTPALGNKVEEVMQALKEFTFAVDWLQKYYFLVRGSRRNLRLRVYQRNRLDVGFMNSTVEGVNDCLRKYQLESFEAVKVGGYEKSPFVSINSDTDMDDRWRCLFGDWLNGEEAGASKPAPIIPPKIIR